MLRKKMDTSQGIQLTSAIAQGLGALVAAGVAIWAIIVAKKVHSAQQAMATRLHKEQKELSIEIHNSQQLLSQRQLLIQIWEPLAGLNKIDPAKPITPDVVRAVNSLELVALCCENGMVDPQVIKRTFREGFQHFFRQIEACGVLPGLGKTGKDLLAENRAAMKFHDELAREHMNQDVPTPIAALT